MKVGDLVQRKYKGLVLRKQRGLIVSRRESSHSDMIVLVVHWFDSNKIEANRYAADLEVINASR